MILILIKSHIWLYSGGGIIRVLIFLLHTDILLKHPRGAWVAQSVKHLPSARVMISGSWDQAPTSGSLLSRESTSPSPSASSPACALTLSLK